MDKSREARRSSSMAAASNGLTKRRLRISESSRGEMHQDVVTVRGRSEKKERDPVSLNLNKRRRSERFTPRSERGVNEDSDDDVKHKQRRKSLPAGRLPRHASSKVADEMIGVAVPRKARSACIKRSPNCRLSSGSGGVGFGEDRRRPPASPGSCSLEGVSPSSSTVSVKQKKVRSCGTIEDELEIEIAEVLSGLKKQPHCSKREEDLENPLQSREAKEIGGKASRNSQNNDKSTNGGTKTSMDGVLRPHSPVSKGISQLHNNRDNRNCRKLDTDLMVPPIMPSSPERVSIFPLVSDSIVTKDSCKQVGSVKSKEKTIAKNEMTSEEVKVNVGKCKWLSLDLEKLTQETSRDSCLSFKKSDWSQPQQDKTAQQSSVLPLTVAVGSWPSEPPSQRYASMTQNGKSLDGSNGPTTLVQCTPIFATQPRPRRCATHFFIAQNIKLHQHIVKSNHLAQPDKGSVYLKGGHLRPAAGNPSLQESSPILSLNSQVQDRVSVNVSPRTDKPSESGHFTVTRQRKPQPPHPPSSSMVPAQAYVFSPNHHLQPVMVPFKLTHQTKNPCAAAGSASVNFNHPSSSATVASSPYFTALPNYEYSFQLSSTISGGAPSQALPFINGSFYSPQMFQAPHLMQIHSEAQKETKAASCSSSSHRQPQPQVSSQANVQKYGQQSQKSEAKAAGDNSDSRGSHTQKVGQNGQIITAPMRPQNYSRSFGSFAVGSAPTNLNFSTSSYNMVSTHQVSDAKMGGGSSSSNADDLKKSLTWKPPAMMNGQTLVFDNPSRTLNFVSGTWSPPAAPTVNRDRPVFTHHLTQTQQQYGRSKATAHTHTGSVPATSSQWKNPATTAITSCNSLNPKQFQSQTQTQISFAAPSKSQPSHGQQVRSGGSCSFSVAGSAPLGIAANNKTNSSKALPLSPVSCSVSHAHDKTEISASGSTQKTSPVCGRNVPPIITSYPGHLSELKY